MSNTVTEATGSDGTGLAEPRARFAAQLAAAVIRRIEVPSLVSVSGRAASIRIGEISLGEANIDRVEVSDVETRFNTGAIFLGHARAIVKIALSVHWWYDFWFASDSGDVSLGSVSFPFDIGNIAIPALSNIRLGVPSATLDEVRAALQPVHGLDLGGGTFEGLQLADTLVPSAGFGLGGLGLGPVSLNNITVPSVSAGRLNLGRLAPTRPLVLPSLRVEGIELPAASAPHIASEGLIRVPQTTASPRVVRLSLAVIGFAFRMQPVFDMFIDRMVIEDLTASASVKTLQVQNVRAPVALRDVSLDGLQLERLTIERITV
jgi:hypothetical protein